jgi:hypothetical protein
MRAMRLDSMAAPIKGDPLIEALLQAGSLGRRARVLCPRREAGRAMA